MPQSCNILILFKDHSTRQYSMPYHGEKYLPTHKAAAAALLKRLQRLGKWAGRPGEDLRHYNGNHATGVGRDPGPKAVCIVEFWVDS